MDGEKIGGNSNKQTNIQGCIENVKRFRKADTATMRLGYALQYDGEIQMATLMHLTVRTSNIHVKHGVPTVHKWCALWWCEFHVDLCLAFVPRGVSHPFVDVVRLCSQF